MMRQRQRRIGKGRCRRSKRTQPAGDDSTCSSRLLRQGRLCVPAFARARLLRQTLISARLVRQAKTSPARVLPNDQHQSH